MTPSPRRRGAPILIALSALAAATGLAFGCATEESIRFGENDCAAGGCLNQGPGSSSSTSSGPACMPNLSCTVSFANDIYTAIFDGPAGCTGADCHGKDGAPADLQLMPGQPAPALAAMLAYQMQEGPYIVPCDPSASQMMCNMATETGTTNPYGKCGTAMPFALNGQQKLTAAQLVTLADWITCGAPDN